MTEPDIKPTVTEVVDKLQALGSSRQIADFFQQQGVMGHRANGTQCAVARYVAQQTGETVGVSRMFGVGVLSPENRNALGLMQYQPNPVKIYDTPLADFVGDFDRRKYPELILDD